MKRTRAQNPKLQDPLDPSAAVATPNPKPQRRAKQPRQPKAAAGAGKKASSSAAAAAVDAARDAAAAAASTGAEMAPTVPDVCGGGEELAPAHAPASEWEYQLDGGGLLSNSEGSWWTFGVEEEKLLGWFPFVEADFFRCRSADTAAAAAAEFDDDIWRIHQIYEIPSYAAK